MSDLHMLTTTDNPFSPADQYEEWLAFDEDHGYYTNGLLARVTRTSDEISETDQDLAVETAINEIVNEDRAGFYKKVVVGKSELMVTP